MVLLGKFLLDLLCAYVTCAPKHPGPEIASFSGRSSPEADLGERDDSPPVVLTPSGGLEGFTQTASEGRKIYAFEGIPYAYPPVGNLRFRNPVPAKPWKGIKKATKPSYCIQTHLLYLLRTLGTEDCLHLNVYTPVKPSKSRSNGTLPVVIAIHGGSFIFGAAAEMGPAYLLNQDVILVGINYRLGPLGFLSTGDEASPGNYGLKDQALAIKWTMDNIGAFGGNASQIFLTGFSAGGVSVHHQMIYNQEISNALVGGLSMSGTAFNYWSIQKPEHAKHLAERLGRLVHCPVHDSFQMIKCLRNINPNRLSYEQLNLMDVIPFPPLLFLPTIEASGPDAFITEMPLEAYARGAVAPKPWITSLALNEGHAFLYGIKTMGQMGEVKRNFDKMMPAILNYRYLSTNRSMDLKKIGKKIKDFYFNDTSNGNAVTESGISEMATDRYFTSGFKKSLQMHAKVAPTYGYFVKYKSRYNNGHVLRLREEEWGVGHAEDAAYFFNMSTYGPGFRLRDPEYKLSKTLINIVTNFIYTGVPTYTKSDNSTLTFWTPISLTEGESKILQIDNDMQMIPFPFQQRADFWDSLGLEDIPILDASEFSVNVNSTTNFETSRQSNPDSQQQTYIEVDV